jgi:hypothetical protein
LTFLPVQPLLPFLPDFFSMALGPHPQRELSLMPRFGFACPQLGMAAGAPDLPYNKPSH